MHVKFPPLPPPQPSRRDVQAPRTLWHALFLPRPTFIICDICSVSLANHIVGPQTHFVADPTRRTVGRLGGLRWTLATPRHLPQSEVTPPGPEKVCRSGLEYQTPFFNAIAVQVDMRSNPTCHRAHHKLVRRL